MEYIIFIFIISSISLVLVGSWDLMLNRSQIRQRLPSLEAAVARRKKSATKTILTPALAIINALLERMKLKEKIYQRLFAARIRLTPSEFFLTKGIFMVLLGLSSYFIFDKIEPAAVVVGMVLGYFFVDVMVNKRIAKRKQAIIRLLPETVDLLSLCMEAGLDFTTAMDWIVKRTRPTPMIEELAFVIEEIRWGKPRLQALKDMAKRLDLAEIRSFVHTLAQAERMGTPVLEVLAMLSEDTRMQRFNRGERIALKAPLKMLIPLIFCILPVIGIVIAGPILLKFMEGGVFKPF